MPELKKHHNMMKNPFWVGKRLYFRGLEKSDLGKNYFQWLNDQEVTQYMYNGMFPNTKGRMKDFYNEVVDQQKHVVFAIIDKRVDRHIGNVGIHRINWKNGIGEYGIIIGEKKYHGKGYGEEATRMILDYIFRRVGLRRVWLGVHEAHKKAIAIYKKVGFKIEGCLRKEIYTDGQWHDRLIMGIMREEYLKKAGKKRGSHA